MVFKRYPKANHLQMKLQRQHFLLSGDPECDRGVHNESRILNQLSHQSSVNGEVFIVIRQYYV